MKVDRVVVGYLQTNCYILSIDNDCIVIDPGDDYDKIKDKIDNKNIKGVIVTHNHFDHVGALSYFDNIYDYNNLNEGINNIDKFKFEVIYTPGHTNDSICIYFKKENIMFTGDFIFKDGIGRTDLGGNDLDMINSIDKISTYSNVKIYPGHGEDSYLQDELQKIRQYY